MSVPSPPRFDRSGIRPKCSDQTLEFWWLSPSGGPSPTGYTLSCPDQSLTYYYGHTTFYTKITGLTNGQEYAFQITAVNLDGSSTPAFYRSVQPGFKPSAPILPTAIISGSNAVVSFTPSASNGDATIKWYVAKSVSLNPLDPSIKYDCEGFRSNIYLTGLNENSIYSFIVNAVNDPGYSQPSQTPFATGSIVSTGLVLDLESSNYFGGSTWNDSSPNAKNATLSAGGSGISYKGYVFFDASSRFQASNGIQFSNNWTISVWANLILPKNNQSIIGCDDLQVFNLTNLQGGSSNFSLEAYNGTNQSYGTQFNLSTNVWTNISVTYNGTNVITYYNASNIGQTTPTPILSNILDNFFIGGLFQYGADGYNGLLGQALIYDRALTSNEVRRNYYATRNYYTNKWNVALGGILCYLESSNYTSGSSTWTGYSPISTTATLTGTGNVINNFIYFDRTTYFTTPYTGLLSNWTLSAWINPFTYVDNNYILGQDYNSGFNYLLVSYAGRYYGVAPAQDGTYVQLSTAKWYNFTVTKDETSMITYLNGSPVGTVNFSPFSPFSSGEPIVIGKTLGSSSNFFGLYGEALIYNRAITPEEVLNNYTATSSLYTTANITRSSLYLEYEASNLSGLNWYDSSSNNRNSYFGTGYSSSNGYPYFNGTREAFNYNFNILSPLQNFTLNCWFYQKNFTSYDTHLVGQAPTASGNFYIQYSASSNVYYGAFKVISEYSGTPFTLINNKWYNIVLLYDGNNLTTYINNVNIGTSNYSQSLLTNNSFNIGGSYGVGVIGLIDNVSLYDRALTSNEISYNYNINKYKNYSLFNINPFIQMGNDNNTYYSREDYSLGDWNGCWGVSKQSFATPFYVSAELNQTGMMLGITSNTIDTLNHPNNYNYMDYGILWQASDSIAILENGPNVAFSLTSTFNAYDTFSINVSPSTVDYYLNSNLLYTSLSAPPENTSTFQIAIGSPNVGSVFSNIFFDVLP